MHVVTDLDPERWQGDIEWEGSKLQYRAIARALESPQPPATIKTDDLLSPYDGTPVKYRLEDGQMVVEVSGFNARGAPFLLKVPRGPNP